MSKLIIDILAVAGAVFMIAGSVALVRFQNTINRLQTATRCAVMGAVLILLAVFAAHGFTATGVKSLLCILFLLMTAPAAAHAIARAAQKSEESKKE